MPHRTLEGWMTRELVTVTPDCSYDEAERLMEHHAINHLLVVDDTRLVGVLSRGDLRAAKVAVAADAVDYARTATVRDAMTPDPVTISAESTIALAAQTMLTLKVGSLPVVDQAGKLCGVLSQSDLCRFIVALADSQT